MKSISHFLVKVALCVGIMPVFALSPAAANPLQYRGFNFPQATFAGDKIPGIPNKDYMWQQPADIDLYADLGANVFRVGFLWERMQPELYGPLNPQELQQLDALVVEAAKRNATILIDVHNYGSYRQHLIGSADVPDAAFDALWIKLAIHYKNQPAVAFGLMNEPNKQSADVWAATVQQAINAIRATGAKQTIFVPGAAWDGAHSWNKKNGDHSNAEALTTVIDPLHNIIFEAHQYFDQDSSGTHPDCVSEDIGSQRLAEFTTWLRTNKQRGFLGEFSASKDPVCVAALQKALQYMSVNSDVWAGWSYWAAAPWFGDYMFNVYPPDSAKFPQLNALKAALQAKAE